uniref:LEM domain-containing protein n=1 Tax=Haplochromis burtoni TaxID=8153 RepID=A0A3Q2UTW0_HAPBU
MSIIEKSDEELGSLLSQYGIKHGPIVDSTRHLYERKLEKAMKQASVKTSSDKTYYREEGRKQPEVEAVRIYVSYQSQTRHLFFDILSYKSIRCESSCPRRKKTKIKGYQIN